MEPRNLQALILEKPFTSVLSILALAFVMVLLVACGNTSAPAPTATVSSSAGSQATNSTMTTATTEQNQAEPTTAGPSGSGQSTPNTQSSAPLIKADGTLKTAMQRVTEADGLRYTLDYTSTQDIPQLNYAFKMDGVASGKLLPNRNVDFTLRMTKGTKGTKHDGEWIMYWYYTDLMAYNKNGGQWQQVQENDLHEDSINFDPTYAYNELGEFTTFGPTDLTGGASPDVIAQMASTYTKSGTDQVNGEAADHYHLVGEAGGVLDIWVSKATGDIIKFQRDVTANGMGTIGVIYLSDIGQPETVQAPPK